MRLKGVVPLPWLELPRGLIVIGTPLPGFAEATVRVAVPTPGGGGDRGGGACAKRAPFTGWDPKLADKWEKA